jgi:AcrR family transcriptional regulator
MKSIDMNVDTKNVDTENVDRKSMDDAPVPRLSRRDQRREELLTEIGTVTRDLLVAEGPPAVTMAAVAERLGVTPPALYRYVDGRSGLLDLACASVARELATELIRHRETLGPDPLERALGVCRRFRRWSLEHREEFNLAFAHPAGRRVHPTAISSTNDEVCAAELRLAWVFEETLLRLWAARPFPVAPDDDLPPRLREELRGYRDQLLAKAAHEGLDVGEPPIQAVAILLEFWTRLYGLVSMEVFGHLAHAVADAEPLFEAALADLTRRVGG